MTLPLREVARRVNALPGVRPKKIIPLLLPMWAAEVTATVRESQPYDVLDRYLCRAIAEAGLVDTAGLAEFLGVEPSLVSRAERFLAGIGHLRRDGDTLALTDLGRQSIADGRRYQLARGRRLVLRFDGFTGAPVPYAGANRFTWLTVPELTQPDGTRFEPVPGAGALPGSAVEGLLSRPDVAEFTGPAVPVTADQVEVRPLWLPAYLVECEDEPLVFGAAVDGPDPYLAGFTPFLTGHSS
ncbi:hypothetical protein AB0F81_36900 [Actinoplanes sp. NPDC024001]|uniref:hypothetical protein n=1 Tax=Actinoplanes sp. NPDC024001 TaxID=3154598 RepID=UPI003408F794